MGSPLTAKCLDGNHTMKLITYVSNQFLNNQSCHKCDTSLNQSYVNRLVKPHYYYCNQCPLILCFNCTKKTNKWKKNVCLDPPPKHKLINPPAININRINLNGIFQKSTNYTLNKYLKLITNSFVGIKEMLQFITKHASSQQLDDIYQSISKQQRKHKYRQKDPIFDDNYFNKISMECTQHMIGYLDKKDLATN